MYSNIEIKVNVYKIVAYNRKQQDFRYLHASLHHMCRILIGFLIMIYYIIIIPIFFGLNNKLYINFYNIFSFIISGCYTLCMFKYFTHLFAYTLIIISAESFILICKMYLNLWFEVFLVKIVFKIWYSNCKNIRMFSIYLGIWNVNKTQIKHKYLCLVFNTIFIFLWLNQSKKINSSTACRMIVKLIEKVICMQIQQKEILFLINSSRLLLLNYRDLKPIHWNNALILFFFLNFLGLVIRSMLMKKCIYI